MTEMTASSNKYTNNGNDSDSLQESIYEQDLAMMFLAVSVLIISLMI